MFCEIIQNFIPQAAPYIFEELLIAEFEIPSDFNQSRVETVTATLGKVFVVFLARSDSDGRKAHYLLDVLAHYFRKFGQKAEGQVSAKGVANHCRTPDLEVVQKHRYCLEVVFFDLDERFLLVLLFPLTQPHPPDLPEDDMPPRQERSQCGKVEEAGAPKPVTHKEDLLRAGRFSLRIDEKGVNELVCSDGDVDGRVSELKVAEDLLL